MFAEKPVSVVVRLHAAGLYQRLALEVEDAVLTAAAVDRQPIDRVEMFPRQKGTLYCFNRIVGAEGETTVYHLWSYGEKLMSRVELQVKSSNRRTWSAKKLLENWPGA